MTGSVGPLVTAGLAAVGLAAALAGCGGSASSETPSPAPSATSATGGPVGTVRHVVARLGGVALSLEVAETPQQRAVGLMGRSSVPPGTGMLFRYDAPSNDRYYMYDVPIPLRAVFVRDGRVVSAVLMTPCRETDPYACPTYGADAPFDTVVETAPATLPSVQPGDELTVSPARPSAAPASHRAMARS